MPEEAENKNEDNDDNEYFRYDDEGDVDNEDGGEDDKS